MAQEPSASAKDAFPALLFCSKDKLVHVTSHGKLDWDYSAEGPILDVQPQGPDRFLAAGGGKNAMLLRKVWKGCRVLWDWGAMEGVSITSLAATEKDESGNPSLILAADAKNQRLFLAEGKSKGVKIRWQFKLPAAPRRVRICPDSNNFLVLLADSTVEEILYQEDKVVWSMGRKDGLSDVKDAVRGPWGHTYLAEGSQGLILCLDQGKRTVWKTHLPFAPFPSFQDASLSLYKKKGKRMILAGVHWPGGSGAQDVVYLLNAETGKVLGWSDRSSKGAYPPFHRVVPDIAPSGVRP